MAEINNMYMVRSDEVFGLYSFCNAHKTHQHQKRYQAAAQFNVIYHTRGCRVPFCGRSVFTDMSRGGTNCSKRTD